MYNDLSESLRQLYDFLMFSATSFIEFWKRRQAVIAWEWDLTNFEEEEQTRPEFEAHVKTTRINPVTKKPEPYLSSWSKLGRISLTSTFIAFMVTTFFKNTCRITLLQANQVFFIVGLSFGYCGLHHVF